MSDGEDGWVDEPPVEYIYIFVSTFDRYGVARGRSIAVSKDSWRPVARKEVSPSSCTLLVGKTREEQKQVCAVENEKDALTRKMKRGGCTGQKINDPVVRKKKKRKTFQ